MSFQISLEAANFFKFSNKLLARLALTNGRLIEEEKKKNFFLRINRNMRTTRTLTSTAIIIFSTDTVKIKIK